MSKRRLQPPSGESPPTTVPLGKGVTLDLVSLAREVCWRYQVEFPDEKERYGDAGEAWCVHDNQHLLNWGAEAVNGYVDMQQEVAWLARVLESRHFPLIRLARNLELGADVTRERIEGDAGERLSAVLANAAVFVRSRDTFLD